LLYVYDVVGEWRSLTGLPAVLAIWAARRDVASLSWLPTSSPHEILDCRASGNLLRCARELELPQPALESYLRQNIDFSLDEENRRGLELYFTHAAKLGLISQAKPLEWVAKAEAVKL